MALPIGFADELFSQLSEPITYHLIQTLFLLSDENINKSDNKQSFNPKEMKEWLFSSITVLPPPHSPKNMTQFPSQKRADKLQLEKTSKLVIDLIGAKCVPHITSLHVQFLWSKQSTSSDSLISSPDAACIGNEFAMDVHTNDHQGVSKTGAILVSAGIKSLQNLTSLRLSGFTIPFNITNGAPLNFSLREQSSKSVLNELFGEKDEDRWEIKSLKEFDISESLLLPHLLIHLTKQTSFPNLIKLNLDSNPCVEEDSMVALVNWASGMKKLEEFSALCHDYDNASLLLKPLSKSTLLSHLKSFTPPPAHTSDLEDFYLSKMFSCEKNFTTLVLRGHEMDGKIIKEIAKSPAISNVTKLHLIGCSEIEKDDFKCLFESEYLNNIVEVVIDSLDIIPDDVISCFTNSSKFSKLQSLSISPCYYLTSSLFRLLGESLYTTSLVELTVNDVACEDDDVDVDNLMAFFHSKNAQNLKKLTLQGCSFSTECIKSIISSTHLTQLQSLDLFDNFYAESEEYTPLFRGTTFSDVAMVDHDNNNTSQCPFPNLKELNLSRCDISDLDLENIVSAPFFPNLTKLCIGGGTRMTNRGILTLCGGTQLTQKDNTNDLSNLNNLGVLLKEVDPKEYYSHKNVALQHLDLSHAAQINVKSLKYLLASPHLSSNLTELKVFGQFAPVHSDFQEALDVLKKFPNGLFV